MKTTTLLFYTLLLSLTLPISTAPAQSTRIKVSEHEKYGRYLTDDTGITVYLFENDDPGKSTCYSECAEAWPPLLTETEDVKAGSGVNTDMLGTHKRKDGALQVTYNDHPLYYFEEDKEIGDVKGQDVKGFGGEWYLVNPSGEAVEPEK